MQEKLKLKSLVEQSREKCISRIRVISCLNLILYSAEKLLFPNPSSRYIPRSTRRNEGHCDLWLPAAGERSSWSSKSHSRSGYSNGSHSTRKLKMRLSMWLRLWLATDWSSPKMMGKGSMWRIPMWRLRNLNESNDEITRGEIFSLVKWSTPGKNLLIGS